MLEDDLKVLGAAFADLKDHSKVISGLHAALRSQNDALDNFWHSVYPTLQRNDIDHIANVNTMGVLLEEEAIKISQGKKRTNTQPEIQSVKRRQTDESTAEASDLESDDIMIPNSSVSLGSIIKREALKTHPLYLQNPKLLTDRQRKIMTAGFSSFQPVVLLSKKSFRWSRIIIKNTLDLSNDFNVVKNYMGKMKVKYASDIGLTRVFRIIKHVLWTMKDYKNMLSKASPTICLNLAESQI